MSGRKRTILTLDEILSEPKDCKHPKCMPKWDEKACEGKTAAWVREHFPRFAGVCPDCGVQLIMYASEAQYICGDY